MVERIIDLQEKQLFFESIYKTDNYYTIKITVKSFGFCGISNFCVCDEKIQEFLEAVQKLSISLEGCAELRDSDSDAFIKIHMGKYGSLSIGGQIGSSYEDHCLKFQLDSDQAILNLIYKYFARLLKESAKLL